MGGICLVMAGLSTTFPPGTMIIIRQQIAPVRATGRDECWRLAGFCLVLAAITFAIFGQTVGFGFLNFDDNLYVYENPLVEGGLSLKGFGWVFTHPDCALYHPLTMLSLMADYQLHGLHAGGYHFTNVLLHTASVILLFLILRQMTGALWRNAFVAAAFAIHPLRVESVAWVTERKDVLGGFFFMLTLAAYIYYVRKPNSLGRYLMVAVAFVLALLSKPTVVTLPFVLLLLDYWPLQRVASTKRLILEKIPLLALAAGACAMTVLAAGKWITPNAYVSVASRIGNALVSYVIYLRQMVWPEGLAVPYPYPQNGLPPWEVVLAGALLAGLSAIAWGWRRTRPWLLIGWLWYLGMLTPMLGVVQVGAFAHADRNTYLPQIGIYVALTWLVAEWRMSRTAIGSLMASVLVVLMVCAWQQTAYWKDSETLWRHSLACTADNELAHANLGSALFQKGQLDEALTQFQCALQVNSNSMEPQFSLATALLQKGKVDDAIYHFLCALHVNPNYAEAHDGLGTALLRKGKVEEATSHIQKALQINPDYAPAHYNLGDILLKKGKTDEAAAQFQRALQINPGYLPAHYNLGNILFARGSVDEAIAHYQQALQINPNYTEANVNLGNALLQKGAVDEAILHYQHALKTDPNCAPAHANLGGVLLQKGKLDEAIVHLQKALQIKPGLAEAHASLGDALRQKGREGEAISQFQQALQLAPDDPEVQNSLAWLLATAPEASLRNGDKAVHLAQRANQLAGGRNPVVLRTLAAAYAETGRFSDAQRSVQKAIELVQAAGRQDLAGQLNIELKRYEAGLPFHQIVKGANSPLPL
jgi:tetratricopeptide (TPR) repeat protein